MKKSLFITIFLLIFLGAHNGFATASSWEIDKAHSNFYFSIDHIFSKVNGHFQDYSGTIMFDPEKLTESKFLFEIKVDSITTFNTKRDKHLLSEDFFDEAKFSTLRFESDSITATGDNSYEVKGKFTVKGKEYDLSFPLTMGGVKDHPMVKDSRVTGFNGSLTIDRLAYGVGTGKFHEFGVVGKDVDILITLELLQKK